MRDEMRDLRTRTPRRRKVSARRPSSVDDRDFLDMLLTEAKEDEEIAILNEPTGDTVWDEPEREFERKETEE